MIGEEMFYQNSSRKVRESSEMSEMSKRKAKNPGFVKKVLGKVSGFVSNLFTSKVIEITKDTSKFDSVIEELENPYLDDSYRKKLIKKAKKMIEDSRISYEQILNDYELTEEKRSEVIEKQNAFISDMQMKLKNVEKRAEVSNSMKKEPNVLEKKIITTREELFEELKKLNPSADLQMVGNFTPYLTSLVSGTELVLPDGFYYDDKLGITNKDNVEGEEYISIKVVTVLEKASANDADLVSQDKVLPDIKVPSYGEKHEEPEMKETMPSIKTDEDTKEETKEEKYSEEDIELTNLTKFDTYSDYLIQYRKKFIPLNDYDQFMNSVIKSLTEGTKIVNVLSEEEFIDEKRKQLERIEQRKIEEKRRKVEIQLIDTENQLSTANEKVEMLERQAAEYRKRLSEMRSDNNSLEQKAFKQNNVNLELERKNKDLVKQVYTRDNNITAQQKQIFELRKQLDAEREARKQDDLKIKSLETQLNESRRSEEAKDQEIYKLNENTRKWRENLSAELNKLSPADDLEKTAQEWVEQRDDFFQRREDSEKKEGKHFNEQSVTAEESEIDKLKQGMKKLTDLINNEGVDNSSEKHHKR